VTVHVSEYRGDGADWDEVVAADPGGTLFQRHGWKQVMERALDHETLYLQAADESGLRGVLPLVRVRSRLFGHYLVSMPFLNYGGPAGDPAAVRALVGHATDLAQAEGADLLELRSAVELPGVDLPVSRRKVTVVLDLPDAIDALWDSLRSKVRSQVRRPRKEGCEVRIGHDQLGAFHQVFTRHMRDLGTPAQGRGFFEEILRAFGDDVAVACVYLEDEPVAAGWTFHWGEEAEITWASSLREHNRIAPNMLLYWDLMEHAIDRGARVFNFGRCTPGSGTHRFKMQWGGREIPLWWYQHSADAKAAATPSPDDRRYALGVKAWTRLPMPVANAIGPRLVRLLP